MFEIAKGGIVIARVDKLQYVRPQKNGVIINCDEKDAHGIVVNDEFYHLPWAPALPGTEDVEISEFSGADALAAIEEALNE